MLLTIRTLSCPPPDDPQTIHAQFGVAGGRIGRSPPCTLILPDPNRHISREHAEIRFRDSAFSIKVVSKVNSVVVNEAVIAPGQAVELSDGDQILIGEYLLQAAIQPAAPGVDALFAPTVSPGLAPPSQDMFSGLAPSPAAAPARAELPPEWFRSPAPAAPRPAATPPAALDEFFQPGVDGSRFADVLQGSPTPSAPDVFAPAPLPAAPVDHRLDQFLGLQGDPLAADPSTAVRPGSGALYRASPLDLPLQAASVPPVMPPPAPAPAPFATHDDIFKALEQDFGALAPPPPAPVLPEAFGYAAPPLVTPAAPVAPPEPPPTPAAPALEAFDPAAGFGVPPPALPELAPAVAPAPLAAAWGEDTAGPMPSALAPADVAAAAVPVPPLAPVPAPAGAAPASADAAQLMAVLTEALGLQPGDLDAGRPEDTVRLVGELLRKSTDGLFRMLEMRAQLKSELHIEDRTMIASRENNPLKHADTPRDAIAYLVDLRQHGNKLFMPPAKAVDDTVWDICAHEMAVMAGTRAALLASLKMFSPEVIEGRIKKTGALENVLPALHKSRLWERFLGMYNELQHEAEDHFDRLLNQEFSKAYAEQSKKLKKKR
ncbi:type VI secretion system-associated FHA domain protein TagH [Piscinibacter sakaiensis]|uniref:FHA domain-containing protein n=1 Tax=Piscinibacter sakaiensis TaxID=1547922 RepID=A0A0K8NX56_PISS1|nr:type VI secretion system-associated FHA domain protein TagH [Piscinibacter sakaiensis]GAP34869.1 hypothetical protein ISF6_0352 [Piscinibacter sakaiensis]